MSYTKSIAANIGLAGLTLKAALVHNNTIHATARDLACVEIGQGFYELPGATIPTSYSGVVMFYVGTLGVASNFTGVTCYAADDIHPPRDENADILSSSISAGGGGSGAYAITVTVTDGTDPLQNAAVRVSEGVNSFAQITDVSGNASFSLDGGNYEVSIVKGGYSFTPVTRTVTGNQAGTLVNDLEMTANSLPTPSEPDLCVIFGTLFKPDGEKAANAKVKVTLDVPRNKAAKAGGVIVGKTANAVSDSEGYIEIEFIRTDAITPTDCTVSVECEAADLKKQGIRLTTPSLDLANLII